MAWASWHLLGSPWKDHGLCGGTPEAWESCAALYIMDSPQSAFNLVSAGQLEKGVKSIIFPDTGAQDRSC